jgi:hypothetical protein
MISSIFDFVLFAMSALTPKTSYWASIALFLEPSIFINQEIFIYAHIIFYIYRKYELVHIFSY